MEEQVQQRKPLKGFGIAGIIVGIFALIFSLFTFAGAMFSWMAALAWYFAIPGLILGILAFIFASKAGAKKTLAILVIIFSIVGGGLGYYGVYKTKQAFEGYSEEWADELEGWEEEMDAAMEELEDMELE